MRRKDREMSREFALSVADKCEYAVLSVITPAIMQMAIKTEKIIRIVFLDTVQIFIKISPYYLAYISITVPDGIVVLKIPN